MTNARKREWLKKMQERITGEDLAFIAEAARAASPGPWILAITPEEWDRDEIAANQTKMIAEGGPRAHFCIHPDDTEGEDARVTAFCGNGPTSEANARFIEIARVALPMLIDEVMRLRAAVPPPGAREACAECGGTGRMEVLPGTKPAYVPPCKVCWGTGRSAPPGAHGSSEEGM